MKEPIPSRLPSNDQRIRATETRAPAASVDGSESEAAARAVVAMLEERGIAS